VEYLKTLSSFISHRITSIGRHAAHSPFLYDLIENVFHPKSNLLHGYSIETIEKSRIEMLNNQSIIDIVDLGAGSKILNSKKRKVADIAKVSLKKQKEALLLLRLSKYLNCKIIIELGTSLGITTLYLSESSTDCLVYTLEGCKSTLEIAKNNFKKNQRKNIIPVEGNFNVTLHQLISSLKSIDMVLFDGNHSKIPTLSYFNVCLEKIQEDSVFVFDDINWNKDMREAWEEICKHPKVSLSIDCWQLGIVFFHKNRNKQHFKISY
jgi:predicted O-methyltransferase YrrM